MRPVRQLTILYSAGSGDSFVIRSGHSSAIVQNCNTDFCVCETEPAERSRDTAKKKNSIVYRGSIDPRIRSALEKAM